MGESRYMEVRLADVASARERRAGARWRLGLGAVAAAALLLVAIIVAYGAGRGSVAPVNIQTGLAFDSGAQVEVTAHGIVSNVTAGTPWIDANGTVNEPSGGWAPCLHPGHYTRIRFGSVYVPSTGMRAVVFIHC